MFWSSYECVSVLCDVFLLKGGRGGEEGGGGGGGGGVNLLKNENLWWQSFFEIMLNEVLKICEKWYLQIFTKKLIGWGGIIWVIFSLFFSVSPHN